MDPSFGMGVIIVITFLLISVYLLCKKTRRRSYPYS